MSALEPAISAGSLVLAQSVEAVRLVDGLPAQPAGTLVWWLGAGGVVLVLAGLGTIGVIVARSARGGTSDEERAYRALAWRMRLGIVARLTLARLARVGQAPRVALLVSEQAFSDAAERAGIPDSRSVRELRARVFG